MMAQAGWYTDPQASDQMRYWDGQQWTQHRHTTRRGNGWKTAGILALCAVGLVVATFGYMIASSAG
jgi:hypothetical protein